MPTHSVSPGMTFILLMLGLLYLNIPDAAAAQERPHLQKQGAATQLIVDGAPFLMIGGELGNSSASSLDYMKPFWPKLERLNLNTVLAPVYWELVEPAEGRFDFALVDGLIEQARARDIYFPNFTAWARRYDQSGNPLFIPEAGRAGAPTGAANAFYAFGAHDAMASARSRLKTHRPAGRSQKRTTCCISSRP